MEKSSTWNEITGITDEMRGVMLLPTCQYHGEFAGVIRVVQPTFMVQIPCMEAAGKADDSISFLSPDSETENDLVVSKMSVIVDRENPFRFYGFIRQEPVVQTVPASLNYLE